MKITRLASRTLLLASLSVLALSVPAATQEPQGEFLAKFLQHKDKQGSRAAPSKKARGGENADNPVAVGQKVPDFLLTNLDGSKCKLSEIQKDAKRTQRGVVVLTFWCSFCHSCRHVERNLDKLAKDFQGKVAVLALDASAGETAEIVRAFAKKKGLTVPIVLDPSGRTTDLFGTELTTTTVVIDREGVLRYCGRFSDGKHAYAEDALNAVLAGNEVMVKTTEHKG